MTPTTPPASQPPPATSAPTIKVIGVGGAGLQAAALMAQANLAGVAFAVVHTDARRLETTPIMERRLLGAKLTRGLGAGGDPDVGRAAAEGETDALGSLCAGTDLVVLVAGLGRGTGSGATPILARVARENGALVLALVALPFDFEGQRRRQQALAALRQLKTACDAVICLPNQKVAGLLDENTTFADTFQLANGLLVQGVRGIWRLLTQPGLLNAAFSDLCHVVRGRQAESHFATAEAMGPNRANEVVQQLLTHALLDQGRLLSGADAVLISLAGGPDLTIKEVNQVMEQINRACENAQVVMGAAVDDAFAGRLAVTLVASKRGQPPSASPGEPLAERAPLADETAPESEDPAPSLPDGLGRGPAAARFAPPAPELPPERVEELLLQQRGNTARQRKKARMKQGFLPLEVVSKGRFAKSEPTVHEGEDLDHPTYVRRGVALN